MELTADEMQMIVEALEQQAAEHNIYGVQLLANKVRRARERRQEEINANRY
jgi:hypothetical protein